MNCKLVEDAKSGAMQHVDELEYERLPTDSEQRN